MCPCCHKQRIFDFCPECNLPLTKQALEVLESLQKSDDVRALIEALEGRSDVSSRREESGDRPKDFHKPKTKKRNDPSLGMSTLSRATFP